MPVDPFQEPADDTSLDHVEADGEWADDEFDDVPADEVEVGDDGEEFGVEPDPIGSARRRHGAAGAVIAAGMFAFEQFFGRKPKEEAPVVVDAPSEPHDIDRDGIILSVDDDTDIVAPALPRTPPVEPPKKSKRR